jgi:hypothetical protein
MAEALSPVVYGQSRARRWRTVGAVFVLAGAAGGALLGVLLGGVGELSARALAPISESVLGRHGAVAATLAGVLTTLVMTARDLGWVNIPIPNSRLQVPRSLRHAMSPTAFAGPYGFGLGLAVATRVQQSITYAALAWMVLTGSALQGAALGAAYGAMRGAFTIAVVHRVQTPEDHADMIAGLDRLTGQIRRLAAAGGILTATVAVVTLLVA